MALRHVGQSSVCKNGKQKAEWIRVTDGGRTIQAASDPSFSDASNRATNLKWPISDLVEIEGRIWGQTDGQVVYSTDDGVNWNAVNTWKSLDQLNYEHASGFNALLPEIEDTPKPVEQPKPKKEKKAKNPNKKKNGILMWLIKAPFRLLWWIIKLLWKIVTGIK